MKIFITGGSGFVGTHLTDLLLTKGHRVTVTGSRRRGPEQDHPGFRYISADTRKPGDWQTGVAEADAVVNLAGRSIFQRWTTAAKKEILESRTLTTRNVVDALSEGIPLISTSAVGFYGDRGEEITEETAPPGDDFLAGVSVAWEGEALRGEEKGSRVVLARFGIVLGPDGGAMTKMLPAFRAFLGGPVGDGRQWFPWIHVRDLVRAIQFVIDRTDIRGPVNFTAPGPVRNREFAETLGRVLNRPAMVPVPGFMIRTFLGELGEALLASQRIIPGVLINNGFEFTHSGVKGALQDIVSGESAAA